MLRARRITHKEHGLSERHISNEVERDHADAEAVQRKHDAGRDRPSPLPPVRTQRCAATHLIGMQRLRRPLRVTAPPPPAAPGGSVTIL